MDEVLLQGLSMCHITLAIILLLNMHTTLQYQKLYTYNSLLQNSWVFFSYIELEFIKQMIYIMRYPNILCFLGGRGRGA
jgi:uncharacterized membrane protein